MNFLEILFWTSLLILVYTYVGYGILIFILNQIKEVFRPRPLGSRRKQPDSKLPYVSLIVAAYNEEEFIREKIENTLSLDYPADKLEILFVTDGSSDETPQIICEYQGVKVLHKAARKGKVAAMNRAALAAENPILIFSDANTILNPRAIREIVKHYEYEKVGAVAGEKKILQKSSENASGAGEGLYWKYESFLKRMDSEFNTVVGAAGELFSIRAELYEPVSSDVLLDDFYITLKTAQKGYVVRYEPQAYAQETSSASVKEEMKRKVRICAGGMQAIVHFASLLNPFTYGWLSFQYISHRVLRWTLAPLVLPLILLCNVLLALSAEPFYAALLFLQLAFYTAGGLGWVLENRQVKIKAFFIPFYFLMMNVSVYRGFFRYLKGNQTVLWEKAQRSNAMAYSVAQK